MLLEFPYDSGPIYQETIAGRFPVEPFNTYSNIVFLVIILYFSAKVYKAIAHHRFLAGVLPILTVGFVGGVLFHATRSHEVWLLMDWVPIMILCIAAVVHFIFKINKNWQYRLLFIFAIIALQFAVRMFPFPDKLRISISYVITAITILTPIFWYLKITGWRNVYLVLLAILSFTFAVTFRTMDKFVQLFPMGTHWLWHLFGGIAVFFLIDYIFKDDQKLRI